MNAIIYYSLKFFFIFISSTNVAEGEWKIITLRKKRQKLFAKDATNAKKTTVKLPSYIMVIVGYLTGENCMRLSYFYDTLFMLQVKIQRKFPSNKN